MPNNRKRKQVRSDSDGSGQPVPANEPATPQPNKQTNRRLSSGEVQAVIDGNDPSEDRIKRLLSRAEVADQLGVCQHTIQRLTRRGLLPAIVFNRRLIRYQPEAVEAFIQSAVTGNGGAK